jgi:anti-sigma-K factor RskA
MIWSPSASHFYAFDLTRLDQVQHSPQRRPGFRFEIARRLLLDAHSGARATGSANAWWRYCTAFLAITDLAAVVAIGRIGYLVEI